MSNKKNPLVSIIMGSQSDWEFVKPASEILKKFSIQHECKIISAHRTPGRHKVFSENAKKRGIKVILSCRWWFSTSCRCYCCSHTSSCIWNTHGKQTIWFG